MIIVDTSVYIAASQDAKIANILRYLSKKEFVQSTTVIQREIGRAVEFLRKTNRKEQAHKLKGIYEEVTGGIIGLTDRILKISNEYENEAKPVLPRNKLKDMKADFIIVASSSVASIKRIITLNRRTMASDKMKQIYEKVNRKNKLITPEFVASKEELLSLFPL